MSFFSYSTLWCLAPLEGHARDQSWNRIICPACLSVLRRSKPFHLQTKHNKGNTEWKLQSWKSGMLLTVVFYQILPLPQDINIMVLQWCMESRRQGNYSRAISSSLFPLSYTVRWLSFYFFICSTINIWLSLCTKLYKTLSKGTGTLLAHLKLTIINSLWMQKVKGEFQEVSILYWLSHLSACRLHVCCASVITD